ncbi:MAG: hypothetical protein GY946_34260, partial [bacterium]|nr:hypothetical protein [bacterium]
MTERWILDREIPKRVLGIHCSISSFSPFIQRAEELCLNAGVVAARLGDQGRPFAVVAKELQATASDLELRIGSAIDLYQDLAELTAQWATAEKKRQALARTRSLSPSDELAAILETRIRSEDGSIAEFSRKTADEVITLASWRASSAVGCLRTRQGTTGSAERGASTSNSSAPNTAPSSGAGTRHASSTGSRRSRWGPAFPTETRERVQREGPVKKGAGS